MIIHETSIQNVSDELNLFLKTIQSCDYIVYGSLILFQYEGDPRLFDKKLIKKIYDK